MIWLGMDYDGPDPKASDELFEWITSYLEKCRPFIGDTVEELLGSVRFMDDAQFRELVGEFLSLSSEIDHELCEQRPRTTD